MAKPNQIEVEILPGGIVKVTSGKISMAIHGKVEDVMKKFIESLGDGETKTTHLPHSHRDTGVHQHGGYGHQH